MPVYATFKREIFGYCYAEARPLLEQHYAELSANPDIPLVPDVERYEVMEHRGLLRCYVARVQGFLAGYGVFIVQPNAHYSTSLQAVQDIFYVAKDWRKSGLGRDLLFYCESALAEEGVQIVHHHVKRGHLALAFLLEKEGYKDIEVIYSKRLDK